MEHLQFNPKTFSKKRLGLFACDFSVFFPTECSAFFEGVSLKSGVALDDTN
jgi:hypothetical protein